MDAFVYVAVRPGRLEDVVVRLQNANGVRAAVAMVGDWDVLVAAHGADLLAIAQDVIRHIHRIEGIEGQAGRIACRPRGRLGRGPDRRRVRPDRRDPLRVGARRSGDHRPGAVAAGRRGDRTLVAIPAFEPADEDRDQFSAWS
jgi:hypothetical protein